MKNRPPDPVAVLAMNIRNCEHCRVKLKEKLLKMPGVSSCDMDIGNNLVLVTGTLDPVMLAKDVAKLGKRVELLSYKDKLECNKTKTNAREKGNKSMEKPHYPLLKGDKACMDYFCKIHPNLREPVDDYAIPRSFPRRVEFGSYAPSFCYPGTYSRYPATPYGYT